jgi:cyclopropane fatty-acyl-phospholipid synthase-like methyltransferase
MSGTSLGPEFFAAMYADTPDPWHFATSAYEQAKYRATIDALHGQRFPELLEIGCSIGVLTALLAEHAERVLALDINERALANARARCAHLPQVRFAQMAFPRRAPAGHFDAVVISEVAYYWSDDDLAAAIDFVARAASGGILVLVHYLPRVDEYVRDGDAVHRAFLADARLRSIRAQRTERYRLDVLAVR